MRIIFKMTLFMMKVVYIFVIKSDYLKIKFIKKVGLFKGI